ncbi:MAG: PolC-type DNA polymerase III [Lachnospiraceae bacterium]
MSALRDYVCIDLETTGLKPGRDRIIEIGAARVRQGVIVETFSQLINPRMELPDRITQLTGITAHELKGQPVLQEILPQLEEFLGEDVLLGHHVSFDYAFLKRAFVNEKKSFEKQGVDTLRTARAFMADCESRKLESLCRYFSIAYKPHRALQDACATVQLYEEMAARYYSEEVKEIFLPRPLIYKIKKESPITRAQAERLYRILERHGVKAGVEIESLTKNEASRYLDQLYAAYGR